MNQNIRFLLGAVSGLILASAFVVVGWMAMEIVGDNQDAFRSWNQLYDYIIIGGVVFSCCVLGTIAGRSSHISGVTLLLLGVIMLVGGLGGRFGFHYLSATTLAYIPPMKKLKPNAAATVLGYHYLCPESGGCVAFGDGSVKYVNPEQFAKLAHADTPDQTPEFISPAKMIPTDMSKNMGDDQQGKNRLDRAKERVEHANNLKTMAVGHFRFQPRDGIQVPLKPQHFKTYPGMSAELKNAISDGSYVWYFGWEPLISFRAEKTRALWYDFAGWASTFLAGVGAGVLIAGLILTTRRSKQSLFQNNKAEEASDLYESGNRTENENSEASNQ